MTINSFRELPIEYLAKIGLELFSENYQTGTESRTLHAKFLYEELYERIIINVPFTDNKGNVLVGFNGYLITLINIRKKFGINKSDFGNSEYPLSKSQKEKLISIIKGSYDFDAVKQRLIIPNTNSHTDEIKTKDVETQLYFIFENLHILQKGHLGLTNVTHFMSRAEIAFEIILCLCDTDRTKVESITKEILFETEQKTYNPYFTHTLKLVNKYYQEGFSGSAISEILDGLNAGGNRHRTKGALYTKKLEFLPHYLSREVYILLLEYLNPKHPERQNYEAKPTKSNNYESDKEKADEYNSEFEKLEYKGVKIKEIFEYLKNKYYKANHKIYVLYKLNLLDGIFEKEDLTLKAKTAKVKEVLSIGISDNRVEKILRYKDNENHNEYPFTNCANKIDEILEDHFNITLPKQQTP